MIKRVLAALAGAVVAAYAGQAAASIVEITLHGTINEVFPGSQPGFSVGDVLTLTTRFDTSGTPQDIHVHPQTRVGIDYHTGQTFYHLWPLPTSGTEFWRIDGDGFTWQASDDYLDGYGGPNIYMDDNYRITNMYGLLVRNGSATVPYLQIGTGIFVQPGHGLYGNTSDPGLAYGTWDFTHASVRVDGAFVSAPEPAAWLLMLAGFTMMGASFRSNRLRTRPS
jgi:hypothetical protein